MADILDEMYVLVDKDKLIRYKNKFDSTVKITASDILESAKSEKENNRDIVGTKGLIDVTDGITFGLSDEGFYGYKPAGEYDFIPFVNQISSYRKLFEMLRKKYFVYSESENDKIIIGDVTIERYSSDPALIGISRKGVGVISATPNGARSKTVGTDYSLNKINKSTTIGIEGRGNLPLYIGSTNVDYDGNDIYFESGSKRTKIERGLDVVVVDLNNPSSPTLSYDDLYMELVRYYIYGDFQNIKEML